MDNPKINNSLVNCHDISLNRHPNIPIEKPRFFMFSKFIFKVNSP